MKRAVTMANVRKALRFPWKGRDYDLFEANENDYFNTPKYLRRGSDSFEVTEEERQALRTANPNTISSRRSLRLTRSTSVSASFRDVMGTLKQKIRKSTRRRVRLRNTSLSPESSALRRSSRLEGKSSPLPIARSEVRLYSPFRIETPPKMASASTSILPPRFDYETPGRIRREVETLTRDMQALATLTPRTLRARSSRSIMTVTSLSSTMHPASSHKPYKSPSPRLLTNGSLRPDMQAKHKLQTRTPVFV